MIHLASCYRKTERGVVGLESQSRSPLLFFFLFFNQSIFLNLISLSLFFLSLQFQNPNPFSQIRHQNGLRRIHCRRSVSNPFTHLLSYFISCLLLPLSAFSLYYGSLIVAFCFFGHITLQFLTALFLFWELGLLHKGYDDVNSLQFQL